MSEPSKEAVDAAECFRTSCLIAEWEPDSGATAKLQTIIQSAIDAATAPLREELEDQKVDAFRQGWLRACVFYIDIDACDPKGQYVEEVEKRIAAQQQEKEQP